MAILSPRETDGYIHFDEAECIAAGKALAEQYQNAQPFPHIVIDDFLPRDFLKGLLTGFPDTAGHDYFDRSQERLTRLIHEPAALGCFGFGGSVGA